MPTEPSARDLEEARLVSPCPNEAYAAPACGQDDCDACQRADAIARALAAREAAVREAAAQVAEQSQAGDGRKEARYVTASRIAAAIRAQGGGA